MVRPGSAVSGGEKPMIEAAEADSLLRARDDAAALEAGVNRGAQVVRVEQDPAGLSFLKTQKNKIYTSRDFTSKGLTHKQRAAIAIALVLMALLFKAMFMDPFRTDQERWARTKNIVDEAVEETVAMETNVTATKSLFELERDAEDFVRAEEGNDV
jgi:hypothetical protein